MSSLNYSFVIVVGGTAAFTYANLESAPVLPIVGERIRCVNPSNGITTDYTVDSKVVTTQLSGSIVYNTVQLSCHITSL